MSKSSFKTSSLVLIALPSLFHLVAAEQLHYDVGMHRFAIRDHGLQKDTKTPSINLTEIPVFNPRLVQKELKRVFAKYEFADETLQGLHLAPELNISLVNEFPDFDDPNAVFMFPANPNLTVPSLPHLAPLSFPASTLSLTDWMLNGIDMLYYGNLQMGTPWQTLSVDIDTGSADLWVVSNCPECGQKQYNPRFSSSYADTEEEFSIVYGAGSVLGTIGHETVSMAGLPVKNQTIGLVDTESHDFDGYPNSGILGLAFSTIATFGEPTLFENLMMNQQVLMPFFSVHLSRRQKTGSEVCLGCYDVSKTAGPVSWVPVVSKTYWTVHMDGMRMNSTSVKTDVKAIIDTGTTFLYVPDQVAQEFYQTIPGTKTVNQFGPGLYSFPCASKLDIAFQFGGNEFPINQHDFNMGKTAANSTDCVGSIISLGASFPDDIAIIGDEFLKSWYTVYDYSNGARVGFAPSINNINN